MSATMYFGGLEGGATHSNLVIVDGTGKVVSTAKGPGTNHWHLGIDKCIDRVLEMLHEAKKIAGIPLDQPLEGLGLTMSGCEQDSTNAELAARAREKDPHCAKAVYVASDTAGSLYTGAPDGGIVLIAGTGSNALLKTADGEQFGCGGWGHLLGDEGGAYWIAHKAVKTVFDDEDGLRPAPFPPARAWNAIREHFAVDSRSDLLEHAYGNFDKSKFAALTRKLAAVAASGDLLSRHLFSEAGRCLADHTAALVRRAGLGPPHAVRVVCVGSVWNSWRFLQPGMVDQLHRRGVNVELELVRLRVSSARGAAGLGARRGGHALPRDDGAFCEVFYKYHPETTDDVDHNPHNFNGIGTQTYSETDGKINGKLNGKPVENGLAVENGKPIENGIESGDWNNGS